MKVISMNRELPYSIDGGLDALWDVAERFGAVSVETKIFRDNGKYEAEIKGETSGGSRVYAKGLSDDKEEALRLAIAEAERLEIHPS